MDDRDLNDSIVACNRCRRLREYCAEIGRLKRRSFRDQEYWTRPVPNFGALPTSLLIVGLAPAAHGANRTGRMFTGDRSGEWLYRSLHRTGFANQAQSQSANDGLRLIDCAITAVCHCAPPDNKPAPDEISNCQIWLEETLDLASPHVIVALGHIAWNQIVNVCRARQWWIGAKPPFAHGVELPLKNGVWLIGSYHPSQQNTFTGRLTERMLDEVFLQARVTIDERADRPRKD